jgi:signal transduction histidine kinase
VMAKSTTYSAGLALAYGLTATAWIFVSSNMAANHSASVEELRQIETLKGTAYVIVTTLAVFVAGMFAMRRMARDAEELVRRERALVASEGKVFAGMMAASVAHDANNVLTAVLADLETLSGPRSGVSGETVHQLRISVERLVGLNRRLLNAARHGVPKDIDMLDLGRVVRDSVATVRSHKCLRNCRIVLRDDSRVQMESQPLLIHQMVSNLVVNAGEATEGCGSIEVILSETDEGVRIEVHDNGRGVAKERRATLFESLATTKPTGTGLGLFSVRACAQGLGGSIEVGDSPLGGAMFRITLPHTALPLTA